ncbi:hypothetical protein R0137_16760 [Congregibacter brevis]|uniref:Tetratricopeptide repeat protein n=1 Tax=Congregibacter brevis TaxID=3081201 RepID=A0ABZ0ICW5_9GAMM|nr:hypothetical protein R0137_16760 [Congregibacter sp. IMCC45268]
MQCFWNALTPTILFCMLGLTFPLSMAADLPQTKGSDSYNDNYNYSGARPRAVELYRQGWAEILERGRWGEAERLYREALREDSGFLIAKSVLARMTADPQERNSLEADIKRGKDQVDSSGRLILDPYVMTLRLISARETGASLPADFRSDLTDLAISNYRSFLERYPGEWAVRIEYIEWIHAKHGPSAALQAISEMQSQDPSFTSRLSYFPAYFHAELGDYERATTEAREFVSKLGPGDWPQRHYIEAFIAYEQGDYPRAAKAIAETLNLDSQHIIAQRLNAKISDALSRDGDAETQ